MAEMIDGYDRSGRVVTTRERKALLKELREQSHAQGDCNMAVPKIHLMLTNSRGQLYVVKRGATSENPYLYDKTVGGHVSSGESFAATLAREALEEVGVKITLISMEEYPQAVLEADLTRQAVVRQIDFDPWQKSVRVVKDGQPWVKRARTAVYVGMYDGKVRFKDGEALQNVMLAADELTQLMRARPTDFAHDLFNIMARYEHFLRPLHA